MSVLILPVLKSLGALVVSVHASLAWCPLRGAHLAVLLDMLESLHESQYLIDVTTDGQVIELHVSEHSLAIYDVSGTEVKSVVSSEAPVVSSKLLSEICEHGNFHAAQATLLSRFVCELLVSEVRVNGGSDDLAAVLSELLGLVTELDDLSGAHECEVEGVSEEDDVLAAVVLETDLLEAVDVPGHALEVGCGVLHSRLHLVVEGREEGCLLRGEQQGRGALRSGQEVSSENVEGLHAKL